MEAGAETGNGGRVETVRRETAGILTRKQWIEKLPKHRPIEEIEEELGSGKWLMELAGNKGGFEVVEGNGGRRVGHITFNLQDYLAVIGRITANGEAARGRYYAKLLTEEVEKAGGAMTDIHCFVRMPDEGGLTEKLVQGAVQAVWVEEIDHGYTGNGETIALEKGRGNDGTKKVNLPAEFFSLVEQIDPEKAFQACVFSWSRLGMGECEAVTGKKVYGPEDDVRFCVAVGGVLGIYDRQPGGDKTVLIKGHSMGGAKTAYQAAGASGENLPGIRMVYEMDAPAIRPTDSSRPDPNTWNMFNEADTPIGKAAAVLVSGGQVGLGKGLGWVPGYGWIEEVATKMVVNGYLPGVKERRPDLIEAHTRAAIERSGEAMATSEGNKRQRGLEAEDFAEMMRHNLLFVIDKGDRMVDAEKLLKVMPKPEEMIDRGLPPIPLLETDLPGGHYALWLAEGEKVRKRVAKILMRYSEGEFKLLLWAVYGQKMEERDKEPGNTGLRFWTKDFTDPEFLSRLTQVKHQNGLGEQVRKHMQMSEAEFAVVSLDRDGREVSYNEKQHKLAEWMDDVNFVARLARYNQG